MLRLNKILFPTDFSPSAEHALSHALYLAHRYGAELHMLNVLVPHEEDPNNPEHQFPSREQVIEKLRTFASEQERTAQHPEAFEHLVIRQVQRREISAAMAIVAYAEEEAIDLVVMGTHGRRGVRHLLAGSVTEEVVRLAPCAVLSVRARQTPQILGSIRKVLAPVDFSDDSCEAVTVALDIASGYGADVQLLHVWENVLHPAFYNMGATSIKDLQPDIEERTLNALSELVDRANGFSGNATVHAVEGHAAREIVRFAEEHDTDLVVIATHGLTGLDHFLLGSVSEKVVRRAHCPVLVVKRKRSLVDR